MPHSESVTDLPPNRLFKYRAFDRGSESGAPFSRDRDIVANHRVWGGSPRDFNDPFDCLPAIDLSGTRAERIAFAKRVTARQNKGKPRAERRRSFNQARKAVQRPLPLTEEEGVNHFRGLLPSLGVLCLAERPDDMLMWGYYADSHRGYCLEFETAAEPLMRAHRVLYGPERTVYRVLDPDRESLMERVMLHKADYWAHEREWRVVNQQSGFLHFPPEALKAIILGANISPDSERMLRDSLAGRAQKIETKRAWLDPRTFRLSIGAA